MGLTVHFEVLNQLGTPLMHSATLANRPAAGIAGRIFFRTDTPFGIYRDTGTIWDLIAIGGGTVDTNIYNTDGTLTANRTVSSGGFALTFNPATTFDTTLTAASNTSSLASFSVNRLSYAAAFSSNNIGNLFGGSSSFNLQTFAGSATFANSNIAANSSINSVDFSTGGSTITMTQATGLRVMAGHINMFQYQGTNSGTITHAAVSQNLGFYRPTAATGILTITNAYGHLINALDDYGAGFTFTNRWGIYQAGASDINYFAAKVLIGSSVDGGQKLQITGSARATNYFLDGMTAGNGALYWTSDRVTLANYNVSGKLEFEVNGGQTALTLNSNLSAYFISNISSTQGNFYNPATPANVTYIGHSNIGAYLGTAVSAPLYFETSGTERARISTAGNLLVGNSVDNGQKCQINGNAYIYNNTDADARLFLQNTDSGSSVRAFMYAITTGNRYVGFLSYGANATGTTCGVSNASLQTIECGSDSSNFVIQSGISTIPLIFGTNNTERIRIKSNGVINFSNVPTSSTSLSAGDIWNNSGVLNIV